MRANWWKLLAGVMAVDALSKTQQEAYSCAKLALPCQNSQVNQFCLDASVAPLQVAVHRLTPGSGSIPAASTLFLFCCHLALSPYCVHFSLLFTTVPQYRSVYNQSDDCPTATVPETGNPEPRRRLRVQVECCCVAMRLASPPCRWLCLRQSRAPSSPWSARRSAGFVPALPAMPVDFSTSAPSCRA